MNTGEHLLRMPNGDTPAFIKNHPVSGYGVMVDIDSRRVRASRQLAWGSTGRQP
jgi:hypothetical protein